MGARMADYLKEAFFFRWNLLLFLGGAAAAALTPVAGVLLPLVAAGELTYLTGLVSVPRFRAIPARGANAENRLITETCYFAGGLVGHRLPPLACSSHALFWVFSARLAGAVSGAN